MSDQIERQFSAMSREELAAYVKNQQDLNPDVDLADLELAQLALDAGNLDEDDVEILTTPEQSDAHEATAGARPGEEGAGIGTGTPEPSIGTTTEADRQSTTIVNPTPETPDSNETPAQTETSDDNDVTSKLLGS